LDCSAWDFEGEVVGEVAAVDLLDVSHMHGMRGGVLPKELFCGRSDGARMPRGAKVVGVDALQEWASYLPGMLRCCYFLLME
jgi:hypothetical protein